MKGLAEQGGGAVELTSLSEEGENDGEACQANEKCCEYLSVPTSWENTDFYCCLYIGPVLVLRYGLFGLKTNNLTPSYEAQILCPGGEKLMSIS